MLLDGVDVHDQDSAEAYIVREPEGLNQDTLLCEAVDDSHDIFGGLNAFLHMGADHWVRDFRPAAEVCKIVEEERPSDMDHGV